MSIDKLLDEKIKWGKENDVVDKGKETKKMLFLDAIFRVSQYKFHGRSDDAYLEIVNLKHPGKNALKMIHEGPILVTKNPCIVAGDVRMFEAVDIPGLRHLSDIIVFPRHGPRPHPDEMAGSDLDGDEYTVIWDKELFLDKNEEAFDFASEKKKDEVKEEILNEKMCEFFVKYMKLDSVGMIANAFLSNSDQYGMYSEVCKTIAKKQSQALDFPKTGISPDALKPKWENEQPPERCERWADFFEKSHEPAYASPRLVGQLYRRVKEVDDILAIAMNENDVTTIHQDPLLDVDGWQHFSDTAAQDYHRYKTQIQILLDSYSIQNESELFTSCFVTLKNRISAQESDDISLYNTTHIIEQRLAQIFGMFRKGFFEKFGDFCELTTLDSKFDYCGSKEVFRRFCNNPKMKMKQLACAYYKIAYMEDQADSKRYLSFAWLVWDILTEIRREKLFAQKNFTISWDPLSNRLSQYIHEFILASNSKHNRVRRFMKQIKEEVACLGDYIKKHLGLDELLYFLYQWGKKHDLFTNGFNREHLCLILIMFGRNLIPSMNFGAFAPWIIYDQNLQVEPIDVRQQAGGLAREMPPSRQDNDTFRMIVSACGTIESLQKLRKSLLVHLNPNVSINCREKALMLAAQVYEQLFDQDKTSLSNSDL
uniref:RNA-dependent RNA polymerase n=2 Tax=Acrobeloides nanus TaxID=290746 RepID=A0A914E5F4_9BILA